jgi:hypothetical protein
MFRYKQFLKIVISSTIILPLSLSAVDNDLEKFNRGDNDISKTLSPLFTIRTGYAYSNWKMPKMTSFNQETQGLNLFWCDLIYKGHRDIVEGNRNFLHYEKSFNNDWGKNEKIIPQNDILGNGGSYELIKGKFTLPFSFQATGYKKSIFIKASMERYLSQIGARKTVGLVGKDGTIQELNQNDVLYFETKFNEIALGINQDDNLETFLFFGDYQKPYTVLKNGSEVEDFKDYLFYSTIKSYGIGMNFSKKLNNFYFNPLLKVGWADIELTDDLKLTDIGFEKSTYFQFKLKLGYSFNPISSIKNLRANIQGVYDVRYFDEPQNGTTHVGENSTNRDEIKKAFVSLQYSF